VKRRLPGPAELKASPLWTLQSHNGVLEKCVAERMAVKEFFA